MVYLVNETLKYIDWSASKPLKRKDTLISHVLINKKHFVPSWDQKNNWVAKPIPPIPCLLAMDYLRQYHKEHLTFVRDQKLAERKIFKRMDICEFKRKMIEKREKKKSGRIRPKVYGPTEKILRPPPVLNYPACTLVIKNHAIEKHLTCAELVRKTTLVARERSKQKGCSPKCKGKRNLSRERCRRNGLYPEVSFL